MKAHIRRSKRTPGPSSTPDNRRRKSGVVPAKPYLDATDLRQELAGVLDRESDDSIDGATRQFDDDPIPVFSQGVIVYSQQGSGDEDYTPVLPPEIQEDIDAGGAQVITGEVLTAGLTPDDLSAPGVAVGLAVTPGINSVFATWTAGTEVDVADGWGSYRVQCADDAGFTSIVTDVVVGATLAVFTGLTTGTAYYVRVQVIDAHANTADWSAGVSATPRTIVVPDIDSTVPTVPQDSASPASPTGLTLSGGFGSVIARWTANSEIDMVDAWGSYLLELNTDSGFGSGTKVYEGKHTAHSAVVTGLTTGTTYYARVKATDAHANDSGWSTSASAAPLSIEAPDLGVTIDEVPQDALPPATPVGLTVTAGFKALFVKWTANTEIDMENNWGTYQVQVATDSGFMSVIADVAQGGTFASFTDLSSTNTYYIRIKAIDAHGEESSWASYASGSPVQVASVDIEAGAIGSDEIADFAVAATKFNTTDHVLY